MPSISPSSEITARCSLDAAEAHERHREDAAVERGIGAGTSSSSSLQERSAG